MLRSSDSKYNSYDRDKLAPETDAVDIFDEIIVMIILIVLASVIRLWKLGEWSFWADEIFSVQDAQKFPGVITINPVAYMIMRVFTSNLGVTEWSTRLGPCIVGILGAPMLYWSARRMFNPRVGIIAALFLVVHPWHIFWSQNARSYSLAFLFAGLTAALFYLSLERDSAGLMLFALLSSLLSIFSYFQSVLLLPALVVYVIILPFLPVNIPKGLNGKNLSIFFAPFILGLLLLLLPSARDYLRSGWGLNEWSRSPLYILFTLVYCLGIPVAVAAFVGGLHSVVYLNRAGLFLICYSIIPLGLLLIISHFLNVAGYYLFFTVPAYLILAALCASELAAVSLRGSKILSLAVLLIVLVFLVAQDYLYFTVENGEREKWREAFQSVKGEIKPTDIVVVSMPRIAEYYLGRSDAMQLKDAVERLESLESSWREKSQEVWFVLDEPCLNVLDARHKFRDWLYANCHLVKEFPVYIRFMDRTINIWHLTYPPPVKPASPELPGTGGQDMTQQDFERRIISEAVLV